MDRVTKQRDPKRQAAGRKGHERYMAKLKEDILKNVGIDSSSNSTNGGIDTTTTTTTTTNDGSNVTSTTTNSGSTITNFSYIHGVGALVVLSLGASL